MTRADMRDRIARVFQSRDLPEEPPSTEEWNTVSASLGGRVPQALESFYEVAAEFRFEGDLLPIAVGGDLEAPDTLLTVRAAEEGIGGWPERMIPFFAMGNGDYLCVALNDDPEGPVYVVAHESRGVVLAHASIGHWLDELATYF